MLKLSYIDRCDVQMTPGTQRRCRTGRVAAGRLPQWSPRGCLRTPTWRRRRCCLSLNNRLKIAFDIPCRLSCHPDDQSQLSLIEIGAANH